MEYMVNLEQFYGPLDLLLYLIEKNEMNIYDIPIALITDQYMDYIQEAGNIDLDHLGDFLVMASYLLNLKSQMLLPAPVEETEKEDEEIADPREELINKLLEYKRFKLAAGLLGERLNDDFPQVFFRHGVSDLPEPEGELSASIKSLQKAYLRLVEEQLIQKQYQIPQGDINVGEKMAEIQQMLEIANRPISFYELYSQASSRREILATFLALLELIRLHKVAAVQEQRFGEIRMVRKC